MNSGAAFSQIRMAADSELRYYFSCLMLGDRGFGPFFSRLLNRIVTEMHSAGLTRIPLHAYN